MYSGERSFPSPGYELMVAAASTTVLGETTRSEPSVFTENGVWPIDSQLCKKAQGDEARFSPTILWLHGVRQGIRYGINELRWQANCEAALGCIVFRRCVMKRETSLLSALAFLLVTVPLMFTQDPRNQPSLALPPDILGPQLIAWSQTQKPQPVPQPLPATERAVPEQQPEQPNPVDNPPVQQQQPTAQKFTGTIVKNSGVYLLKVSSNNAYQLDDQEKAKQYEGKQVIIGGTLDANGRSLHVINIELLS
jgi:hypothetical protein